MKRNRRLEAALLILVSIIGMSFAQSYADEEQDRDVSAIELEEVDENYEYEAFAEAEDLSEVQQAPAGRADISKEEIEAALPGTWISGKYKFTFDDKGSFACEADGEITQGNYILAPDYAVRDYSDGTVFIYFMDGTGGKLCPMYVCEICSGRDGLSMKVILRDGTQTDEIFSRV